MVMLTIALMFVAVFLLNRTEGFKKPRRNCPPYQSVTDTVEAMAIGIACSSFVMLLLQEITLETPLKEALGKIVFESVPFTLGVALANNFLGDTRNTDPEGKTRERSNGKSHHKSDELSASFADVGATLIGATVLAFNIAPTDEIPMLAAAVSPPWLLVILASSLVISYGIVFEAGFSNQQKRRQQEGIFQRPLSETVMSYLVSLLGAAFMLWFFQQLTFDDPWTIWLEHTLLLGLPATIGGAAGRLAL
ncbi:TIGR02587 family membrane protein [Scytonema sp. NUACC21]